MKIIFVGLHNKPHKTPLCSSTKSGKLIDRIIKGMPHTCQKTNLFDVEFYPTNDDENFGRATEWWDRVDVDADDVLVLLGAAVHRDFVNLPLHENIIKIAHPASKYSHVEMNEYVATTIEKIITVTRTKQVEK